MIIERLKSFFDDDYTLNQRKIIINNAIDNIEALRAENAGLRAALKPLLADYIKVLELDGYTKDTAEIIDLVCAARAALEKKND